MRKIGLIVKETSKDLIKNNLKDAEAFLILRYRGLSSPEMTELRQCLGRAKANLFVVKNSVARRALKESGLQVMLACIEEPCGFVFINQEPVEVSRALYNFSRDHDKLKLGSGFFKDKVLEQKDIETMAKLPPKDVLRTKAAVALKSPISAIVMALSQILKKFVYCLEQIATAKAQK